MAKTKMVQFSGSNPSSVAPRTLIFKEFRDVQLLAVLDAALTEQVPDLTRVVRSYGLTLSNLHCRQTQNTRRWGFAQLCLVKLVPITLTALNIAVQGSPTGYCSATT
jgi:hypothetical protein